MYLKIVSLYNTAMKYIQFGMFVFTSCVPFPFVLILLLCIKIGVVLFWFFELICNSVTKDRCSFLWAFWPFMPTGVHCLLDPAHFTGLGIIQNID